MKSLIYKFALTISLLGLTTAAQSIETELEGTIRDVDSRAMSITVELDDGGLATYALNEDTDVTFLGDPTEGFDDLRSGQDVILRFDDEVMYEDWILIRFIEVS